MPEIPGQAGASDGQVTLMDEDGCLPGESHLLTEEIRRAPGAVVSEGHLRAYALLLGQLVSLGGGGCVLEGKAHGLE